jgi:energy-coupling factor transport system substrate-specific component
MLAAYGAVASLAYGLLLNLWLWPFLADSTQIAFLPGAPIADNLVRWFAFTVATSLGFDIPRAILTTTLIIVIGHPVLVALRRAGRRAAFTAPVHLVSLDQHAEEGHPARKKQPR